MKKLSLTLLLSATYLLSSPNELKWVDEQIEAIKPPRVGLDQKALQAIKDPFILLVADQEEKKEKKPKLNTKKNSPYNYKKKIRKKSYHFRLTAIMNKSALINGKWYREGDHIHGYKISQVNSRTVTLTNGHKRITLSTITKKTNLKFNKK